MNDAAKTFVIGAALALFGALALAIALIGAEALRELALILIAAVAVAIVLAASALPIRAARKRDMTGETRIVDGTKTIVRETRIIDGRTVSAPEVKLLQLPAQPSGGAFPELLRAAYSAGLLGSGRPTAETPARSLPEVDLTGDTDDAGGWGGDITA